MFGFAVSRSERIEEAFGCSGTITEAAGADVDRLGGAAFLISTTALAAMGCSFVGVNFFLLPLFFAGESRRLGSTGVEFGGCPSSLGSSNLVFCILRIVDGIIGSWLRAIPSKLLEDGDPIEGTDESGDG